LPVTCFPHILADGGDGLGDIAYFIALAALAIIAAASKALQARAEKRQQAEVERRIEEARRRRQQAERGQPAQPARAAPQQRPQAAPTPPTPYAPAQRQPARPAPPPAPPVLRPMPAEVDQSPRSVAEELEQHRRHEQQQERRRRQRLAAHAPGVRTLTTLGVGPAAAHIADARPPGAVAHGPLDAPALRQAVIYREILSPPKSLRREPDSWEL